MKSEPGNGRSDDNQLAYIDQASFRAREALGHEPVQQLIWVYHHELNMDRLREFHNALGYTLVGRRIERSPLPFGRARWVLAPHQADLEVSAPRRRDDLSAWIDEQAAVTVDPEHGPAWRMAVLPFVEGGAAVSVVCSHSVADVGGMIVAGQTAMEGKKIDLGYPMPGSRTRRRAMREDLKEFRKAVPEIREAFKAAKEVDRGEAVEGSEKRPLKVRETVTAIRPSVFVAVPIAEWDARGNELWGNGGALVAAFAARLGFVMGQTRPDGSVILRFPVTQRGDDSDLRANALTAMSVSVDPVGVLTKLGAIKIALVRGLRALRNDPNPLQAALPLSLITPKWVIRRLARLALGEGPVVGCTNMGDVPDALSQIDGTTPEFLFARGVEWPAGPAELDRIGDWLLVGSCRLNGNVLLFVTSWLVGTSNSRDELAGFVRQALADFQLTGTFV